MPSVHDWRQIALRRKAAIIIETPLPTKVYDEMKPSSSSLSQTVAEYHGPSLNLDLPKRQAAIEIEVEGTNLPTVDSYWDCVPDNSLRNGGIEYVSKQPYSPVFLERSLKYLERELEGRGADFSANCSTHIHINVRPLSWLQLWTYTTLLLIFEDHIICPERKGNNFCARVRDNGEYHDMLIGAARDNTMPRHFRGNVAKYMNINLSSVITRGSLEIRGYTSTIDSRIQMKRVKFLLLLRKLAMTGYYPNPAAVVEATSIEGVRNFFHRHTGNNPDLDEERDMQDNIMLAQDIAYANTWKEKGKEK